MSFEVRLTPDALADLEEIVDWIAVHDAPARAAHVEERILGEIATLAGHAQRGAYPRELLAVGMRAFRQVYFRPYRIIYGIEGRQVEVYVIADGRRDFQALLARRLLAG